MLSAEALSASDAQRMREHLSYCPSCMQEWQRFQTTLLVLTTATQAMPSARQTEQLWEGCAEHIFQRTEARRLQGPGVAETTTPAWMNWVRNQPAWGWVALGSAVAVLGGAWWFSPQDNQPVTGSGTALADLSPVQSLMPPPDANSAFPGRLITFQRPPALASSMVDSHTTMTYAPFVDHVGTLIVSSSATDGAAAPAGVQATRVSAGAGAGR
jgi:hypothetical protein